MAQELGKVQRPAVGEYQGKRKLLLVPLMYSPPDNAEEGRGILERYWDQVRTQIDALEKSLGPLRHIYCESLAVGGSEGLEQLETGDRHSYSFVQAKFEAGASLQPTEDQDTLAEILDLQRFMMLPLASEKVAKTIHDWFTERNKSRYEYIAQQVNATLGEDEAGLLLISERHQVQFPPDIEVFYVAPPALDEYRRWLQHWASRWQHSAGGEGESAESAQPQEEAANPQPAE